MKYCPLCGDRPYVHLESVCPTHNKPLLFRDPYGLVGDETKSLFNGRYRVDKVVGLGGMAVIYRAQQLSMNRRVAIKVPLSNANIDTNLFEREMKIAGGLSHENIIVIYDCDRINIGTTNSVPYIAMEWLEGGTLEQRIYKGTPSDPKTPPETKPLSLRETASILRQIAAALNIAHKKGVIHRDIKPSNIMLVPDDTGRERVKVLDFGISKAITEDASHAKVSKLLGTPFYCSPEQTQMDAKIDQTSDIYSLGVMLYQMLSGKVPFFHPSEREILRKHGEEAPPRISEVSFDAIVVEEVLLRMMAKSPEERPKDVMEVADFFDRAIIPVRLEGMVTWSPGDDGQHEPVAGASVKLNQERVPPQSTDEKGAFSFDKVINTPPFWVTVQAQYFKEEDGDLKPEQSKQISLTPLITDLSGWVEAQMPRDGGGAEVRELGNVELRLKSEGDPGVAEFTSVTDGDGRFTIRLVGPQHSCIDTIYNIHIDGFQDQLGYLRNEMRIIVKPDDKRISCPNPNCGRSYPLSDMPKFCQSCRTQLRE